jgi:hypothetical protein
MSTQGKGNFTFKILKNGAKESDLAPVDNQADEPAAPTVDLDTVTQKRSGVTARAGGIDREKLGTPATLGRKRQR